MRTTQWEYSPVKPSHAICAWCSMDFSVQSSAASGPLFDSRQCLNGMRGAQASIKMRTPYLENHAAIEDSQTSQIIRTAMLNSISASDLSKQAVGVAPGPF